MSTEQPSRRQELLASFKIYAVMFIILAVMVGAIVWCFRAWPTPRTHPGAVQVYDSTGKIDQEALRHRVEELKFHKPVRIVLRIVRGNGKETTLEVSDAARAWAKSARPDLMKPNGKALADDVFIVTTSVDDFDTGEAVVSPDIGRRLSSFNSRHSAGHGQGTREHDDVGHVNRNAKKHFAHGNWVGGMTSVAGSKTQSWLEPEISTGLLATIITIAGFIGILDLVFLGVALVPSRKSADSTETQNAGAHVDGAGHAAGSCTDVPPESSTAARTKQWIIHSAELRVRLSHLGDADVLGTIPADSASQLSTQVAAAKNYLADAESDVRHDGATKADTEWIDDFDETIAEWEATVKRLGS